MAYARVSGVRIYCHTRPLGEGLLCTWSLFIDLFGNAHPRVMQNKKGAFQSCPLFWFPSCPSDRSNTDCQPHRKIKKIKKSGFLRPDLYMTRQKKGNNPPFSTASTTSSRRPLCGGVACILLVHPWHDLIIFFLPEVWRGVS